MPVGKELQFDGLLDIMYKYGVKSFSEPLVLCPIDNSLNIYKLYWHMTSCSFWPESVFVLNGIYQHEIPQKSIIESNFKEEMDHELDPEKAMIDLEEFFGKVNALYH